ncbi:hypothetical protein [Frisingicoccus sp.]|uniref:hypothetical protein n=1 Tax=Frisingicoccus sp. TaxID=1918627 RepID=UPI00399A195D
MAFIDDLKQGLSDVTKTVYEKSEQFVGIQKLRLKKNSLNNELKATYIEIGKMVYEEKKAGAEFSGPVVQLCQKVDLGLEAIQEVEAQIEEAKAKNEVEDDDFDADDIFEEEVEEAAAEAEEAAAEAEEAAAEAEEAAAEAEEAAAEAEEAAAEAEEAAAEVEEAAAEAEEAVETVAEAEKEEV